MLKDAHLLPVEKWFDLLASITLKGITNNCGINVVIGFFFSSFISISFIQRHINVFLAKYLKSVLSDNKNYFNVNSGKLCHCFTNYPWGGELARLLTLSDWSHMLCKYDMCIFLSEQIYFYFQSASGRRDTFLSFRSKYLNYYFLWSHSILTASFIYHQASGRKNLTLNICIPVQGEVRRQLNEWVSWRACLLIDGSFFARLFHQNY